MGSEINRKLASVRRINEVKTIEGADSICAYRVDGWWVVDSIGKYVVGDLVIYAEPDSWIPTALAPFLTKPGHDCRQYNGVNGERLRTIRLRGQVSQGLLLPLSVAGTLWSEGDDVTEFLGIQKWEKPLSAQLAGMARGNFPEFLRKTDQERIQNLPRLFDDTMALSALYEVTTKLDGSSMTVWFKDGDWGVCSRNLNLKTDQEGNTFVDTAKRVFADQIGTNIDNLAFQGELMGPGVQGNRENFATHRFFVFDIWHIDQQRYLGYQDRKSICEQLGLEHVPVSGVVPLHTVGVTIQQVLDAADNTMSINHRIAEGLVFKRFDGAFSFKAISNKFLLKEAA